MNCSVRTTCKPNHIEIRAVKNERHYGVLLDVFEHGLGVVLAPKKQKKGIV